MQLCLCGYIFQTGIAMHVSDRGMCNLYSTERG